MDSFHKTEMNTLEHFEKTGKKIKNYTLGIVSTLAVLYLLSKRVTAAPQEFCIIQNSRVLKNYFNQNVILSFAKKPNDLQNLKLSSFFNLLANLLLFIIFFFSFGFGIYMYLYTTVLKSTGESVHKVKALTDAQFYKVLYKFILPLFGLFLIVSFFTPSSMTRTLFVFLSVASFFTMLYMSHLNGHTASSKVQRIGSQILWAVFLGIYLLILTIKFLISRFRKNDQKKGEWTLPFSQYGLISTLNVVFLIVFIALLVPVLVARGRQTILKTILTKALPLVSVLLLFMFVWNYSYFGTATSIFTIVLFILSLGAYAVLQRYSKKLLEKEDPSLSKSISNLSTLLLVTGVLCFIPGFIGLFNGLLSFTGILMNESDPVKNVSTLTLFVMTTFTLLAGHFYNQSQDKSLSSQKQSTSKKYAFYCLMIIVVVMIVMFLYGGLYYSYEKTLKLKTNLFMDLHFSKQQPIVQEARLSSMIGNSEKWLDEDSSDKAVVVETDSKNPTLLMTEQQQQQASPPPLVDSFTTLYSGDKGFQKIGETLIVQLNTLQRNKEFKTYPKIFEALKDDSDEDSYQIDVEYALTEIRRTTGCFLESSPKEAVCTTLETLEKEKHSVHSNLMAVKILFVITLVILTVSNWYTAWITEKKMNTVFFYLLMGVAFIAGLAAILFLMYTRRAPLTAQNISFAIGSGIVSLLFYLFSELSGANSFFRITSVSKSASSTSSSSSPSTSPSTSLSTSSAPGTTTTTTETGTETINAMMMKEKSIFEKKTVYVLAGMFGIFSIYALYMLMMYSTGFSKLDGVIHNNPILNSISHGLFMKENPKLKGREYMPSYQDKNTKLFQEALVFSFCMVIPYVLVYLFYNFDQIEEAFKDTEMWSEFGLLFFKFFVFFYILNSLDLFKGIVIKIQDAMTQASSQILEKYTNYCIGDIGDTKGSKPPVGMMTTTPSGKQTYAMNGKRIQNPVITPVTNPSQGQKRISKGSLPPSVKPQGRGQQQILQGSTQPSAPLPPSQGQKQILRGSTQPPAPNLPVTSTTVSSQNPGITDALVVPSTSTTSGQGKRNQQLGVQ